MTTTSADYSNLPESVLVALARLILKRARLSLPVTNREQAVRIIRGIKPAPSRKVPLSIKPCVPLCRVCHQPMPLGTLCDYLGRVHISCQEASK